MEAPAEILQRVPRALSDEEMQEFIAMR